ncbi:MAG: adenylosuccinate synthase [Deltaproteobacteria bacterium]|nr:adenylosuccinate synthase [Deltaproteobacteria bacterium]
MPVQAVVGANWGDEGKGKITDFLAGQVNFVVRYQGGRNAGHTIINQYGKNVLHLLPSGVFYPQVRNILGSGMALDLQCFFDELADLAAQGVPQPKVQVSNRAQIVMPYHVLLDQYEEERLGRNCFGSTLAGIAPFYSDKYGKLGIQVADLFDRKRLRRRIDQSLTPKNILLKYLYGRPTLSADELISDLIQAGEKLAPFVCDSSSLLDEALAQNRSILLEGQLGALRDPDHGIYPFTTSSSTLAGFASVGAGLPAGAIGEVVAVTKAYSTCVGDGPFITEIFGSEAERLRERGGDAGEYGATTGRPRRIGWFDVVATRYGCRLQGATEVALSMLDVLGFLDEIPICTAYAIDGQTTNDFPPSAILERAKPLYEFLSGWKTDISGARSLRDLPTEARTYIRRIEALIEVPIRWISVGPEREAIFQNKACV